MRGIAALGVVAYHARDVARIPAADIVSRAIEAAAFWGQYGVWLFFVVSGFCIHMRWARRAAAGDTEVPGFWAFWRRRWLRLYPPYLAALAIYVWLMHLDGIAFTSHLLSIIGLHIVLAHNLYPPALNAINGVFWTLAIEEQLYLLYFVLLPLRIRYGWAAALIVTALARLGWFVLAAIIHRAFEVDIIVTQSAAAQWMVWTLGALSVEVWCGLTIVPPLFKKPLSAAVLLIAAAVTTTFYLYGSTAGAARNLLWLGTDYLWGVAFFVVVNWAVSLESTPTSIGRRLAGLGLFSYSLYLSHEIVTHHLWPAIFNRFEAFRSLPRFGVYVLLLSASIAFAWVFFWCFERPFLRRGASDPNSSTPLKLHGHAPR